MNRRKRAIMVALFGYILPILMGILAGIVVVLALAGQPTEQYTSLVWLTCLCMVLGAVKG